jgi:hypothetical protein
MKCRLFFGVLLCSVALVGCKPSQIAVVGQVFIVTKGAENVRLGAVEVLLVERPQATDLLGKIEASVESRIALRRQELIATEEMVKKVKADFDSFRMIKPNPEIWLDPQLYFRNRSFLANPFFDRDVTCVEMKSRIETLWQQRDILSSPLNALNAQWKLVHERLLNSGAWGDMDTLEALEKKIQPLQAKWEHNVDEANSLVSKLKEIVDLAEAERKDQLERAERRLMTAQKVLEGSPTPEDYLQDLSPVPTDKAITDADGRFSFTYPRNKPFAVFASAQRRVAGLTEKYYWLINAPTTGERPEIFLNNNNLIFVDPDGFFKLKPKQL